MNADTMVVVGGGLTGLAVAVDAAQRGLRVLLLERSGELGGRGQSDNRGGFVLNLGPHALFPRAYELLGDLGVRPEGRSPRVQGFAMRIGERLFPLPSGARTIVANGALTTSGKWAVTRYLGRAVLGRARGLDGTSVAEWLRDVPPDARGVIETFVRVTTYSHAPERLSAGAAIRQIESCVRVRYVDGGWQRIVDALATRARELGVEVRLRTKVDAIEHERGRVRAIVANGERIACESAVITLGPKATLALLADAAPRELRAFAGSATPVRAACLDIALRSLPRSHPTLVLGVDRPTYLAVHSSTARIAPDGGAVVHVARYLAPGETVDSAALRADLERELDAAQPGWRDLLVHARWSPALTVMHALPEASQGGLASRPDVGATGIDGVALAGDWIGPRGLLFDACLESARAAVDRLIRARALAA